MKKIIKDYFTFSKKERTAIIILLLLIGCFIAAPWVYRPKDKPPVVNKELSEFLMQRKQMGDDSLAAEPVSHNSSPGKPATIRKESFPFDPNTIDEKECKRLGISDKNIRTILNYRNKGGKFRNAEDLRKIWGFRKEDADRLIPFVNIPSTQQTMVASHIDPRQHEMPERKTIQHTTIEPIDVNTATSEEWKALPGIGEVLSGRIVKYRERAGGFRSVEQVHKIYGIDDSLFKTIQPYLKLDARNLPQLDINTASAYELQAKANIPQGIAKAIVIYRQQNGPFQSVNDLKKVVLISDSLFQRVAGLLKTQ